MAEEDDDLDAEAMKDYYAFQASRFRESWEAQWFGYFDSFEDTTSIPCMRFTYKKPEQHQLAYPCTTLQIFSLKVAGIREGIQWPLHVFGTVYLSDSIDHNRNTIFDCNRENCQILTQEVPCLTLTGPIRAVVLTDPVTFEVDLKVKGSTESKDKDLSSLAVPFMCSEPLQSCPLKRDYTSKLSTLEFALGLTFYSLEATITVRVTHGSWSDALRVQFSVRTASIGHEELILLDSGDNAVPVAGDGLITLSGRVASVEAKGELKVAVKALLGDEIVVTKEKGFKPKKAGTSVAVAWSLIASCLVSGSTDILLYDNAQWHTVGCSFCLDHGTWHTGI